MSVPNRNGTDPYGNLEFAIGSADDFVCFDYANTEDGLIRLHAVVNSETGCFIQDFDTPISVPKKDAVAAVDSMISDALCWCAENEVEHDAEGWNQDPRYFARAVKNNVEGGPHPVARFQS